MLSRRNLMMMLTMFLVVLVLFSATAVLREYFNDYDTNHAAQEAPISPVKTRYPAGTPHLIYVGTPDSDVYRRVQEWAGYRKLVFHEASDVRTGTVKADVYGRTNTYLLLEGSFLEGEPQRDTQYLEQYVKRGGRAVFCTMPTYQTIGDCDELQRLLGIQKLRGESVELQEIWLYKGFLLGGEVCYPFDELQPPERIDMARRVPWYDISAGTKSYMVGYVPTARRLELGLSYEDLPAIIWRNSLGDGSVFAVNGDFMADEIAFGLLDAMVYESGEYALYGVVNAQNLSITGFPDLTSENEAEFQKIYAFDSQQFCRDILWPSLVAAAHKGGWKMTTFLAVKQSNETTQEPDMPSFIEYLKYYNEESVEAGMVLGRKEDPDVQSSMTEERERLTDLGLTYAFTGGFVRPENQEQVFALLNADGTMPIFSEIRTVITERDPQQPLFSWMTDQITRQSITADGYAHTYKDNLRLKSLQTAFGYSNVQADIFRVIWKQEGDASWEHMAQTLSSQIDTYWKPFSAFEKTTITESDRRVRNFLNERITSEGVATDTGRQITIGVEHFEKDAFLLLRTHGENLKSMEGGTWKQIEEDAYLLHLTESTASVVLQTKLENHYYSESVS